MAKLRVRDIEGDADEIKNLFKDLGCDLNTYINTKPTVSKIPTFWLYVSVPLFFVLSCLLWIGIFDATWTKVITLFLFLILGITSIIVHFNHNNCSITSISFFTGLCLILICLNVYTPSEISKKIEKEAVSRIPNTPDQ